ncbi:MFS transporter [Arthrobacter sp. KFRI-F3372]|uniref:MFS transporter n=1 Tax=Micrococcaceae TaxID=1268 RepID=UPI00277F8B81|nr:MULTISPECIES: MFS transporter [Micrococcaceae]MDP9988376.1 MFS family permease [Arthrobacter oryzae]MEE2523872.1 MFS transporter [Pseudarthrobacter sp. J47]MEE2530302.1 MFS transporter [Pseudarthrobacter sp. J75]WHP61039.1 MFS transporter [Arthrobacter sp. KFRI-F3372]
MISGNTPAPRQPRTTEAITLGLRQNLAQFMLLVAVNALVGGTLGQERTVLPLLAGEVFHLDEYTSALTYILAFGLAKAATNYFAGTLSDRYGRKPILIAGWLIALPVPVLLIFGPSWGWIVAANVVLGISQGLTWSTTVMMKMDLVGPERRGLAMGLNEAAGYLGVAGTALATGYIASTYGLRPGPFLLGAAFIAVGLGLSVLTIRETHHHAKAEAATHASSHGRTRAGLNNRDIFTLTSFRDKSLSSVSQAGMVNNLNDGLAWGLFPVLFAAAGLSIERIGILAAVYPAVWGAGQLVTGALSDRIGRKPLIVGGMLVQAVALGMVALGNDFEFWLAAVVLLGAGTAMVYPTLLAAIGDVAHPGWRARSVGIYRLWRDGGFAVGALLSGLLADAYGIPAAVITVAALTAASGVWVALRMRSSDHAPAPSGPARIL